MTDTTKLSQIIDESGLKMAYIAQNIGISGYSLSKKINNVTEFKTSEIKKLCKLLNITSLKAKDDIFFANDDDE